MGRWVIVPRFSRFRLVTDRDRDAAAIRGGLPGTRHGGHTGADDDAADLCRRPRRQLDAPVDLHGALLYCGALASRISTNTAGRCWTRTHLVDRRWTRSRGTQRCLACEWYFILRICAGRLTEIVRAATGRSSLLVASRSPSSLLRLSPSRYVVVPLDS